jgi:hypothetical protein
VKSENAIAIILYLRIAALKVIILIVAIAKEGKSVIEALAIAHIISNFTK